MSRDARRLQTVARLRETQRDEARRELADAVRAAETLDQQNAQLNDELTAAATRRIELMTGGGADAAGLLATQRYELTLRAEQRTLADQRHQIEGEIVRRRERLTEADRAVRSLEKLGERAAQRARRAALDAEARTLDEHAARRHAATARSATRP